MLLGYLSVCHPKIVFYIDWDIQLTFVNIIMHVRAQASKSNLGRIMSLEVGRLVPSMICFTKGCVERGNSNTVLERRYACKWHVYL
jgi:hypothetical protein